MINKWLESKAIESKHKFNIINISENNKINEDLLRYLSEVVLFSYRPSNLLKRILKGKKKKKYFIKQEIFELIYKA